MAQKKDSLAELKAAIGKQIKPHEELEPPAPRHPAPHTSQEQRPRDEKKTRERRGKTPEARKAPEQEPRSGRGMHFYLDETDRRMMNSLAVWFASQDRRVSDSQVIKASLRLASEKQNTRLLDICDEVRATDRRRQSKRKPEGAGKS
jgi:hypothetical protein